MCLLGHSSICSPTHWLFTRHLCPRLGVKGKERQLAYIHAYKFLFFSFVTNWGHLNVIDHLGFTTISSNIYSQKTSIFWNTIPFRYRPFSECWKSAVNYFIENPINESDKVQFCLWMSKTVNLPGSLQAWGRSEGSRTSRENKIIVSVCIIIKNITLEITSKHKYYVPMFKIWSSSL